MEQKLSVEDNHTGHGAEAFPRVLRHSPFGRTRTQRWTLCTHGHTLRHVFALMLACLIRRALSRAWAALDVTVEEGPRQPRMPCSTQVKVRGCGSCLRIPTPGPAAAALLKALEIRLPEAQPHTDTPAVTRKQLPERRKPR